MLSLFVYWSVGSCALFIFQMLVFLHTVHPYSPITSGLERPKCKSREALDPAEKYGPTSNPYTLNKETGNIVAAF